MSKKLIDFTVGADPEFVCLNDRGQTIYACDLVSEETGTELGADGNHKTFEVRPAPSENPIKLVANIHDIFVRQSFEQPEFLKLNWKAGSYAGGFPLGGHVHFGLDNKRIDHMCAATFLDNYVGVVSLLLEDVEGGLCRRDDGYGIPTGDAKIRTQPWGFEYRVMSSWLSSPYVSAALLCLSKVVMYEAVNNPNFKWHKFAQKNFFEEMKHDRVLEKFPKIWADIVTMKLYQEYKPYIDLIYFLVSNRLTWFPATSMKESWGVVNMQPCLANKIGMDVIWSRYNQITA